MRDSSYDRAIIWLTLPSLYFPFSFVVFFTVSVWPNFNNPLLSTTFALTLGPVIAISFVASPIAIYLKKKATKSLIVNACLTINLLNVIFCLLALLFVISWIITTSRCSTNFNRLVEPFSLVGTFIRHFFTTFS